MTISNLITANQNILDSKTMMININNKHDFIFFLDKYSQINQYQTLSINFSSCSFVRSNFLAIVYGIIEQAKNINLNYNVIPPKENKLITILCKNNFLPLVFPNKYSKLDDNNDTVISLESIEIGNKTQYYDCIKRLKLKGLNNVSEALYLKIIKQIAEVLNNSFRHSKINGKLYYAGQFFPHQEKLYFTLLDFGVGISSNVNKFLKKQLSGKEAIKWALTRQNTTYSGEPGGLGLYLLKNLILSTQGELEIISSNGHYKIVNSKEEYLDLEFIFQGTAINIVFNTSNKIFSKLKGE
jgi:hypothetical protein